MSIKKITLLVMLFLVAFASRSQSFEGIIKWTIKAEITDPATKAKMEEAQKKMKDPATQAQMKELEKKMEDPQFKAMLESNPQMKTQMEAMLKAMQGGDINSFIPTGFTYQMKNDNTLSKVEGGIMDKMEVLYLNSKKESYKIDRSSKTYAVMPTHNTTTKQSEDEVKVTKTSETTKILDYTCTKYIAESTVNGKPTKQFFWTTTQIKDINMKSLSQQRMGNNPQAMFYEKIEGVPLKIEMSMPEGNMIIEVTSIKRQSLPAADFTIPAGYKEVDFSFGKIK